jgi:undecaprenyl-diphosphatase
VFAALWLAIAADVLLGGPISHLDVLVADRIQGHGRSAFALVVLLWTHMHSHAAILSYSALFALLLARRRQWAWFWGVVIGVPGGLLLNYLLKLAVERSRPVLDNPLLALETYSFPSGHTAAATLFYGVLAAYLISRYPAKRRWIVAAALLLIALVAYSRMYLGVHYLGDVLAALCSSATWLILCLGGVHAFFARHR